jgi:type I restriction enzyme S subunit
MPDLAVKTGWTRVAFGDVVRQVRDRVDPDESGLERFVAGEHMDSDDLRIRRWGQIGEGYLGPAFHMRFKPGHVLYGSRRTYLRKVAIADFEGITANTTFVVESRNSDVLLPGLLPFIMQTDAFHEHSIKQSKGSVNPYINFSDLTWYEFFLPPPDEQKRIASLLTSMEVTHQAMSELCVALRTLSMSLLIDHFDTILRDDAVRKIPVGQAGAVLMGRQRSPKYESGPSMRPYLRVANVYDGYIDTKDIKKMQFSDTEFRHYCLQSGDILLNEGQSRELVGRSAIFYDEIPGACFQNTLIRFRPSEELLSDYAQSYFRYCLYTGLFIANAKQTTSIAHLGVQRFANMLMPVPSRDCQAAFISVVSSLDSQLHSARRRQVWLRDLKRFVIENALGNREVP